MGFADACTIPFPLADGFKRRTDCLANVTSSLGGGLPKRCLNYHFREKISIIRIYIEELPDSLQLGIEHFPSLGQGLFFFFCKSKPKKSWKVMLKRTDGNSENFLEGRFLSILKKEILESDLYGLAPTEKETPRGTKVLGPRITHGVEEIV